MSDIVSPEVEAYLAPLAPPRDAILEGMEALAAARGIPIVGPLVGAFLYQLAHTRKARRIFELGSAIGYSTIWLARGAGPGSETFYTDFDEGNAAQAQTFFEQAGVADRIQIKVGNALESFAVTGGSFDLIFNDVDKVEYPLVFKKALPRLRKGGLLISDNVLRSGKVARAADPEDKATLAVQEFNQLAAAAEGCVYTILPLRDGVGVLLKL